MKRATSSSQICPDTRTTGTNLVAGMSWYCVTDDGSLSLARRHSELITPISRTEMASNVVVVGTQWGDEGKGKVVDWLTEHAAGVVRFQGGHNAGHTLVIGDVKNSAASDSVRHSPCRCALLHRQRCRCVATCVARGSRYIEKRRCRCQRQGSVSVKRVHVIFAVPRYPRSGTRNRPRARARSAPPAGE